MPLQIRALSAIPLAHIHGTRIAIINKKSPKRGFFYSADGAAGVVAVSSAAAWCIISWRRSLCCAAIFDFDATNANAAHSTKNIAASHAVARVRKFPAAAPVNAPPNIDAAEEPDMPLPSDFCSRIIPIIKTATIIKHTNKIENIFFSFDYGQILTANHLNCKDFHQ